jgi:uncharacterized protein YyaL (SSP411 family)
MEHVLREYRPVDGGLTDVAQRRGGEGMLQQWLKPVQDSPTPSPNGVAAIVMARLAGHTADSTWLERCGELLQVFAGGAAQLGVHGATLLRGLDWFLNPAAHIVVVGDPKDSVTMSLRRTARITYRPRKVITLLETSAPRPRLPATLRAMIDGKAPRAYLCVGTRCAAPVETEDALRGTLETFK